MLKIRIAALKYLNALAQEYKSKNTIRIITPIRCQDKESQPIIAYFKKFGRDKEELT